LEEKRAKAEAVLERLRKGEGFEALMNAESEAQKEPYVIQKGMINGELEEAIRAVAPGETSEVIESPSGFHIFLRLEYGREEVRESLQREHFNDKLSQYYREIQFSPSGLYEDLDVREIRFEH
jgi:parvulin-like peptidyl-prolyl isomerase